MGLCIWKAGHGYLTGSDWLTGPLLPLLQMLSSQAAELTLPPLYLTHNPVLTRELSPATSPTGGNGGQAYVGPSMAGVTLGFSSLPQSALRALHLHLGQSLATQEAQLSRAPLLFTAMFSHFPPAQEPIALRIPTAPTVPTTCLWPGPISPFIGFGFVFWYLF